MLMSHLTGITVMHVTHISPCTYHLITSHQSLFSLSPSITPSDFHSRLNPFHKSSSPYVGLPLRNWSQDCTYCALDFSF